MRIAITILFSMVALVASALPNRTVMVNTNAVLVDPTNLWMANSNAINAVIHHPVATNAVATLDGFDMQPAFQGNPSNHYWLDFGQVNGSGESLIYATLMATNDVRIVGVTNCVKWRLLSFNVVASGGDRLIQIPTNFPHLSTNGLTYTNASYQLKLLSGNEFRMTVQSNSTLSTLWTTFGQ